MSESVQPSDLYTDRYKRRFYRLVLLLLLMLVKHGYGIKGKQEQDTVDEAERLADIFRPI